MLWEQPRRKGIERDGSHSPSAFICNPREKLWHSLDIKMICCTRRQRDHHPRIWITGKHVEEFMQVQILYFNVFYSYWTVWQDPLGLPCLTWYNLGCADHPWASLQPPGNLTPASSGGSLAELRPWTTNSCEDSRITRQPLQAASDLHRLQGPI